MNRQQAYKLTFLWIFLVSSLLGFSQQNPFELKYRLSPSQIAKGDSIAATSNHPQLVHDTPKDEIQDTQENNFDTVAELNQIDTIAFNTNRIRSTADTAEGFVDQNTDKSLRLIDSMLFAIPESSNATPDVELDKKSSQVADSQTTVANNSPKVDIISDAEEQVLPPILQDKTNLIVGTFIVLVLYLTVVISFNRSIIDKIIRSILNDNYLNLFYREFKGRWPMQLIFLYFFFVANLALFVFLYFENWTNQELDANLLELCVIIGGVYFVRHLSLSIIGNTYEVDRETGQYSFTILLFNILLGLFLMPINLFIAFSPLSIAKIVLYIGLTFIVLFYFLRVLRGFFIGARFLIQHSFHFLLYLCTVEITPMLVLFEFFTPYLK